MSDKENDSEDKISVVSSRSSVSERTDNDNEISSKKGFKMMKPPKVKHKKSSAIDEEAEISNFLTEMLDSALKIVTTEIEGGSRPVVADQEISESINETSSVKKGFNVKKPIPIVKKKQVKEKDEEANVKVETDEKDIAAVKVDQDKPVVADQEISESINVISPTKKGFNLKKPIPIVKKKSDKEKDEEANVKVETDDVNVDQDRNVADEVKESIKSHSSIKREKKKSIDSIDTLVEIESVGDQDVRENIDEIIVSDKKEENVIKLIDEVIDVALEITTSNEGKIGPVVADQEISESINETSSVKKGFNMKKPIPIIKKKSVKEKDKEANVKVETDDVNVDQDSDDTEEKVKKLLDEVLDAALEIATSKVDKIGKVEDKEEVAKVEDYKDDKLSFNEDRINDEAENLVLNVLDDVLTLLNSSDITENNFETQIVFMIDEIIKEAKNQLENEIRSSISKSEQLPQSKEMDVSIDEFIESSESNTDKIARKLVDTVFENALENLKLEEMVHKPLEYESSSEYEAYQLVDRALNSAIRRLISEAPDISYKKKDCEFIGLGLMENKAVLQEKPSDPINIVWPTISMFSVEKCVDKINEFILTWALSDEWLHCIDYMGFTETRFDKRHRFRVRFSMPTRRKPIPTATASVYFTVSVSKIKPSDFPIDVFYVVETNRLIHRPGEYLFCPLWLHRIVESKNVLMKMINF